jgi:hypothetical protein
VGFDLHRLGPFNARSVKNLEMLDAARPPNARIAVAIGNHGNTYGYVLLPPKAGDNVFPPGGHEVPDGAHRVDCSWVDRLDLDALRRRDSPRRNVWEEKAERRARMKAEPKRKRR